MSLNLELLTLAEKVALSAGELLLDRPNKFEFDEKSGALDFATQKDHQSEALIVSQILNQRPLDGLIGEEGANKESESGITWVIDPIDGTVNYLSKWNGTTSLKNSIVYDTGSAVGIGSISPNATLDVAGNKQHFSADVLSKISGEFAMGDKSTAPMLTKKESEVLRLIAQEFTNQEMQLLHKTSLKV